MLEPVSEHTGDTASRRQAVRVATYNIHRCRGMDGMTRPQRILDVLSRIDADIVALQEVVGAGPSGGGQAELIGAALGMGWVMAVTRHVRGHLFGNVVLSRLPIRCAAELHRPASGHPGRPTVFLNDQRTL